LLQSCARDHCRSTNLWFLCLLREGKFLIPLAVALDAADLGSRLGDTSGVCASLLILGAILACRIQSIALNLSFATHVACNRCKRLSCGLVDHGDRPSIGAMVLFWIHISKLSSQWLANPYAMVASLPRMFLKSDVAEENIAHRGIKLIINAVGESLRVVGAPAPSSRFEPTCRDRHAWEYGSETAETSTPILLGFQSTNSAGDKDKQLPIGPGPVKWVKISTPWLWVNQSEMTQPIVFEQDERQHDEQLVRAEFVRRRCPKSVRPSPHHTSRLHGAGFVTSENYKAYRMRDFR
jgi:hypothetical protein